MATLSAIEAGLDARLATIAGLSHSPRLMDGGINPPCALIEPRSQGEDMTLGGGDPVVSVEVLIVVPLSGSLEAAQTNLDAYLSRTGASSIEAAIYGDDTLGGAVSYCIVKGWRDRGIRTVNGADTYGAILEVEVQT